MRKMPYGDTVKKGRSMKAGGDNRESGLPGGGKRQRFAPPVYKEGMNKGTKPPVYKDGMNKGTKPLTNQKGSEVRRRALMKKMSSM
jgi:hypothetical protein